MIENTETNLSEIFNMKPELSAFEAKLASLAIRSDAVSAENIRQKGLLELCRTAQESATKPFIGEKLASTIVKSGEQEITLSLRQYIRSVRVSALLVGLLIGFILGGIAMLILVQNITQPKLPRDSNESPSLLMRTIQSEPLSSFNFSP